MWILLPSCYVLRFWDTQMPSCSGKACISTDVRLGPVVLLSLQEDLLLGAHHG